MRFNVCRSPAPFAVWLSAGRYGFPVPLSFMSFELHHLTILPELFLNFPCSRCTPGGLIFISRRVSNCSMYILHRPDRSVILDRLHVFFSLYVQSARPQSTIAIQCLLSAQEKPPWFGRLFSCTKISRPEYPNGSLFLCCCR